MGTNWWQTYRTTYVNAAPLAVFRMLFGLLMLISLGRFAAMGWIEKLYLNPTFHFSYYGFAWVKPLGVYTYGIFGLCALAATGVMLGYRYRWSMGLFFLSWTYIELMDKTTYLNHYYFVSVMALLLFLLPAAATFSLDAHRQARDTAEQVPRWCIDAIKLMLTIVYFYAGLAKLNSDWLLEAQPLATWLATKTHLPIIGPWLGERWVHFAFSWSGAIYDLAIPFLLWYRPTRALAYVLVVVFHLLTRLLFPIGMFPYIMIVSSLIFLAPSVHQRFLQWLRSWAKQSDTPSSPTPRQWFPQRLRVMAVTVVLGVQLVLPFRYLLYPGELFWTEQGFRFSWRVMLMEKAGYAQFKIIEPATGKQFYVDNTEFLNAFQEKQMAFQPDFIIEYAHYLADTYAARGVTSPEVYVESYVALNGRSSQPFVDPTVNLAAEPISLAPKTWLLPFQDEIRGF